MINRVVNVVSRLWLGVVLILICATVLVRMDRKTLPSIGKTKTDVAVLVISARTVMEDFLHACRDTLTKRGYVDGETMTLRVYNPQGDLSTANTMADDIVQRSPDIVITASTPMLQVMANRNKKGTVRHVFGLVTDPFSAVSGLDRDHPRRHPPYMGGYGTFQPVEPLLDILLKLRPGLKKLGTIRNAGEACSEATFLKAKAFCDERGIELKDQTVESTADVLEATRAVLSAGVEGIWIGGDNTVEAAIELVVKEATKAGVPVFTHSPTHLKFGTAISLGADYYVVGEITCSLAADVLDGKVELKNQKIENKVPELLAVNPKRLTNFTTNKTELANLAKQARMIVAGDGEIVNRVGGKKNMAPITQTPREIFMLSYNHSIPCENAKKGFLAGLEEAGLKTGRDVTIRKLNAAGDMATLPLLVDTAITEEADLISTFSTPTLQAVIKRDTSIPVVYSFVASGVVAGAGKSLVDHRKNVTGVDVQSPIAKTLRLIKTNFPRIKKIGFVYTAGSSSTEYYVEIINQEARKQGFELASASCGSSMEVVEAIRAVLSENVDAFVQIPDNNVYAAFETLLAMCAKRRKPVFCNASVYVEKGACLALATDYYDCGKQSAHLAVRVLSGESPASIPFEEPKRVVLYVNQKEFASLGIKVPDELLKKADKVFK